MQSEVPIEFWSWNDETRFDAPPPHRVRLLRKIPMPRYRGAWLFALLAMRRNAAGSAVRAVHITDPEALTPLPRHRVLTTVYDLIPLKEGISRKRVVAWAGYRTYLRALPRADVLFAISGQTASDLVNLLHVSADRVVIARPGIDLVRSDERPKPTEHPYFLFLGGPNRNKNLSLLLDALVLCPELPEELRVAGRWLPKQLAALNATLQAEGLSGRVHHVGFVPTESLAALMEQATALVIPSLDEGFGLPVGEGLAACSVVIHSRIPVLEETSAGSALTFDPRSASELASCLRRVSTDAALRSELRARGCARAAELTWDAAVEATLATYRRILQA